MHSLQSRVTGPSGGAIDGTIGVGTLASTSYMIAACIVTASLSDPPAAANRIPTGHSRSCNSVQTKSVDRNAKLTLHQPWPHNRADISNPI